MVRKCELRQSIVQDAERIKNKMTLEKLAVISGLFRKYADDEDYELLSEAEWMQISIIFTVLQIHNPRFLRSLKVISNNFAK